MQITEVLIRKFFEDACTAEEADMVSQYFAANPEELKKYLGPDWAGAMDQQSPVAEGVPAFGEKKGLSRRIIIGWAAAVLIMLIAGARLLQVRQKETTAFASAAKDTVKAEMTWKWQVQTNPSAERKKIVLPDNTVVTLFAQAKIVYRHPFPADHREIILEGEASFNVAKDAARPFTVKAGHTTTTVLGTCFAVQQNEQGVTVKLYRGKVSVRAVDKEYILSPGEQVKVATGKDTGEVSLFRKEIAESAGHGIASHDDDGVLVFDNTPLPEVMEKLMRRYGVTIRYNENELSNMYFTGSVFRSDSLSIILRGIGNINDLKIVSDASGFAVSASPH